MLYLAVKKEVKVNWEKPWKRPFENLLSQLSANVKGEISSPKSRPETRPGAADTSYFVYPSFRGELQEQKFSIEISEFPAFTPNFFEAADNLEYLRIFVIQPSQYSLVVTHESWLHQFKKKFLKDREFQSGNKEFDKRYYLRPESEPDRHLLKEAKFQESVKALEPFSVLEILKSGIFWSQQITDEKQLVYSKVEGYLKKTLELAKTIASRTIQ